MHRKEIMNHIRNKIRDFTINRSIRNRLKNHDFTLISSDCTGGMLYHELNHKFMSPTINMYFEASEFIKFAKNIKQYIDIPMAELKEESREKGYPVALLGDIKLYLVHYTSIEEAQKKWDERKLRINWNNCFYIMNDRNNCSLSDIQEFDALTGGYNGVFFSHLPYPKLKSTFYISDCKDMDHVDVMIAYISLLHRRYDQFDWVHFLNK